MKRRAPVAMFLMVLVAGLLGTPLASAQDGPTQVGEQVTFIDPDGIIRGTVAIREVADPFTGHEPTSPPEPGTRYVMLTTTFQAAADQPFDAQPYQVMLQGTDGTLWSSTYVPRPATDIIPDLQAQPMAPDNRVSGVITYVVPEDVTIERVVYQPAYDRFLSLLELAPGSAPAPGEPITYTDAQGSTATISSQVTDPFTDLDPAYPPEEGMRYVALQPVFENTGSLPYWADPYDLAVRDDQGFIHTASTLNRPPGFSVPLLESQTMSPGDRVSGMVGFAVPADVGLADVLYYPESSRIVRLADLNGGGSSAPVEPVEEPGASPAPVASAAPVASPEPEASAGTDR